MYSKMDINKIFDLFDQSSSSSPSIEENEQLFDLKNTPVFWLGMFKKIIISNNLLYFQLNSILPDGVDAKALTNNVIYNRSWEFIEKIDISKATHMDALKLLADNTFIKCFGLAISYYESNEEYEKCAHLKKIQDRAREFANKA